MHIPRIYLDDQLAEGMGLALHDTANHHIIRVLRLKPGETITLFNGKGGEYHAVIKTINRSVAVVEINSFARPATESALKIHLGQGISRSERMDYCIQKSVELGVNEITPLFTKKCDVKLKPERIQNKLQHWQRIVISACEQSGRTIIPVIHPPTTLEKWVQQRKGVSFVCDPDQPVAALESFQINKEINLLIGPESGLASDEVNEAARVGFKSLSLGPRVLRTETAAVVAITLLQSRWGDLPR